MSFVRKVRKAFTSPPSRYTVAAYVCVGGAEFQSMLDTKHLGAHWAIHAVLTALLLCFGVERLRGYMAPGQKVYVVLRATGLSSSRVDSVQVFPTKAAADKELARRQAQTQHTGAHSTTQTEEN